MATLSKLTPGQILYDVHSERMGNTTIRRQGVWKVRVIEVYEDHAVVSWNGNPPRKYRERDIKPLRVKEPLKLNGHLKGCRRRTSLGWGEKCTCKSVSR